MELESDNLEEKKERTTQRWTEEDFFGTVAREHLFVVFIKYQITVTVLPKYTNGVNTVIHCVTVKSQKDVFSK